MHLWREVIEVHRREHGYSDADLAALARVDLATLADLFPENFKSPHTPLRLVHPRSGRST